jgi:Bacterial SH3 domain
MPFHFKALSAALSIIAAAPMTGPVRAQQSPPPAGQESAPGATPQDGPAIRAPITHGPARAARARSAAVAATVNLRSGPGTDSEIITTIPAGSTVRVTSCSGEWCEVTWNDRSGYAIARNLSIGAPRQAGAYGPQPRYAGGYGPQPGYGDGYGPEPGVVYGAPGYYAPPAVVYGPAYYGPRVYYGPGWGWRRRWW